MNQPDTIDLTEPKRTFPQWIADHNPFFLISGVLMLAGCYMITHSVHDDPDVVWPIVGLVAVFNVYEFMVIGLATYLGRRRVYYRDAGFLLFLEVLLLSDVGHSYNELILKSVPIGLVVSAVALGLAAVKVHLISRGLGLRITKTGAWMLSSVIALLFVVPILFRQLMKVELAHESQFYAAWWVVGAIPLVVTLTQPWFRRCSSRDPGLATLRKWVAGLLIVVPIGSLLLHLRTAHYVDDRSIEVYNFSPVILGLVSAWIVRWSRRFTIEEVVATAFVSGTIAVMLSIAFPNTLVTPLLPDGYGVLSPLRLVLVVTALQFGYLWWWRGAWLCLPAAVGLLTTAGLGHNVPTIRRTIRQGLDLLRKVIDALFPSTTFGWGVLAVVASFVFLMIGATASLVTRTAKAEKPTG